MSLSDTPNAPIFGYGAGFVLSLAAHVGAAALLVALMQPRPVTDQPLPKSQIRIETQSVQQSQAKPQAAAGDKAQPNSASGAAAAQGIVKESKAEPAVLPQTRAQAETPSATALTQSAPPTLTAPARPVADRLSQSPPPPALAAQALAAEPLTAEAPPPPTQASTTSGQTVAAIAPPPPTQASATSGQTISASAPPPLTQTSATAGQTIAAVAPPPPTQASATSGQTISASAPPPLTQTSATSGQTVAAAAPIGQVATATQPQAQTLPSAAATGQQMTATLAWAGAGSAIDPVSLKAIASFMRPGDTAARADDVHDGLQAILSSAPCSRLQAEFNPASGSLELRGHVPDAALKGPLLAALQAQLGEGIKVTDAMVILPRPQCGALSGIADVGLPQSQDQLTNPRLIGADAQARTFSYTQGQTMVLDLAAPDYDAYVYVDYFDAGGNVIHLVPNTQVPLKLRNAKSTLHVGAADASEPFLHITIGPPYGQEIAAAFAASRPLYDGNRPLSEPAGPYLDWLKTRVADVRAKDPDFKGEWVYFMVSTQAQ